MTTIRLRLRDGDREIEVEGAREDVDDLLATWWTARAASKNSGAPKKPAKKPAAKKRGTTSQSAPNPHAQEGVPVAAIVNAIHEADNYEAIETHILNKRGAAARILLCFVFAKQLGVQSLRTSDVEAITDGLGVKLHATNVAKSIREGLRKYLSADGVTRPGVPMNYKINRRGRQAYDKYVKGQKP